MPKTTALLHDIALFRDLPDSDRLALFERASLRLLDRGEVLVRQGDMADTLYYVLRGRFDILRDGRLVAEIGGGEPVGEIAFFAGLSRTADVIASRDSEVLELSRSQWDDLRQHLPLLNDVVLRALGQRLAKATATAPVLPPQVASTIGICPAGQTPVPESFVQALHAAFKAANPQARLVSPADLPRGMDSGNPQSLRAWFRDQEGHGPLLIRTGTGDTAWDQLALRQCDHLLLVGCLDEAGQGPVKTNPLEDFARPLFRERQCSLALWRRTAVQNIADSRHWILGRNAALHHHVALDVAADMARLQRFLTGRALGAVFGGGGAFGAAHIGACRALHQAGLRFDLAGGTSIGSIIAQAVADQADPSQMLEDFLRFLHAERAMGKLTWPVHGLIDSHHVDRVLRQAYGGRRVEDSRLAYFAVTANITTNRAEALRRGEIWRAIRASVAIPGALPPYISEDGDILVDGGIMENVPITAMRGLKQGPNVIFSLNATEEWRVKARYEDLPRRWRTMWNMALRRGRQDDYPRIGEVITQAMQVTSGLSFREAGQGGDMLLMLPALRGMGLLSFRMARQQEELGYDHTSRMIDQLGGPEGLINWQGHWSG